MKNNITEIRDRIDNIINETLPKEKFSKAQIENIFTDDALASICDFSSLLNTVNYTLHAGGKHWRSVLLVLSAYTANQNITDEQVQKLYELTSVIEFIHSASLIHDDIEDASEKRRGEPAAHIKFGTDTALNAGSWLYFYALQTVKRMSMRAEEKAFILEMVADAIVNLHLGQTLDIAWHNDENFFPSVAQYEQMIRLKTGTLAGLAAAIGTYFVTGDKLRTGKMARIMQDLGIAFQIADDVKNISTGIAGKNFADDIVEGKKSLPVILHCEQNPDDKPLVASYFKVAKIEGIHSNVVSKATDLLQSSGCIEKAQKTAIEKTDLVKIGLSRLNVQSESLAELQNYITDLIR